jgi:putative FmdB family regulatory protein
MPIFEYHCMKCDKDFETLVFGKEEVCCPHCQGTKVKKHLSTFSYKNDGTYSSSSGSSCGSCGSSSCSSCGSA